ncbi:hypothetical protein ACRRTK_003021 [Alexandromys fortis]
MIEDDSDSDLSVCVRVCARARVPYTHAKLCNACIYTLTGKGKEINIDTLVFCLCQYLSPNILTLNRCDRWPLQAREMSQESVTATKRSSEK